MKKYIYILPIIMVLFLSGCATVNQPSVTALPEDKPNISKTILADEDYSLKRKVSIVRFSNETQYGQGNLFNNNDNKISLQAMDILSTKLAKSDCVLLFERPEIDEENFKTQAGIDSMNFASDYIIIGSVSEFGRKATSKVGIFSRSKRQTASAKVNIRLVNIKTGQIIYAEEGSGEAFSEVGTVFGAGSHAGYDSSLNDKALDSAISKLVSNIVENLLNEPWKSYVLDVEVNSIIISGGVSQKINIGDIFQIKKRGKLVKNPQTGIEIELPGEKIGLIKVKSFYGKSPIEEISYCDLIEGNLEGILLQEIYVEEVEQ